MRLIQQIYEPKRLLLAWQASSDAQPPNYNKSGKRYIVGELTRDENNGQVNLRYFRNNSSFVEAVDKYDFKGHGAYSANQDSYEDVLEVFLKRIPPRTRSDFEDYLKFFRIAPRLKDEISDFALLGYTGAKLPGDGFSLIYTFENVSPPCEVPIEIAGFRHHQGMDDTPQNFVGADVRFEREPNNEHDCHAVKILSGDKMLGYVPRGQAETFCKWLDEGRSIAGVIERVNGKPDKPNILVIVSVK